MRLNSRHFILVLAVLTIFVGAASAAVPYWIDSNANMWVNVSVPAGTNTTTLYILKNATSAVPNGDQVFPLFDNFSSVNTSKWTFPNTSAYDITNGIYHQNSTSGKDNALASIATFPINYTIMSSIKTAHVGPYSNSYERAIGWFGGVHEIAFYSSEPSRSTAGFYNANTSTTYSDISGWSANNWYTLNLSRAVSQTVFSYNGSTTVYNSNVNYPTDVVQVRARTINQGTATIPEIWIDWLAVRKYSPTEPTITKQTQVIGGATYYVVNISSASTLTNYQVNLNSLTNYVTTVNDSFYIDYTPIVTSSFTADNVTGLTPLTVQFSDTSTGAPTSWSWDFGDNNSSTAQNPIHTFTATGTYNVSLNASNAAGSNTITKVGYIIVIPIFPPVANFSTNVSSGYVPLSVNFTDQSTNATSFLWDFGDGTNSTAQNPIHTYRTIGSYTVSLTVTNAQGSNSNIIIINSQTAPTIPTTTTQTTTSQTIQSIIIVFGLFGILPIILVIGGILGGFRTKNYDTTTELCMTAVVIFVIIIIGMVILSQFSGV